jgi:glucosylceramidase
MDGTANARAARPGATRRSRHVVVGAVALVVATVATVAVLATGDGDGARPARMYVTVPHELGATPPCDPCLEPRPGPRRRAPGAVAERITVDPSQRFHTVDGFGFAMTDSSAFLLGNLPAAERDRVMRALFDRDEGIGVSWMRVIIGPSDFTPVPPPWYSYRPSPDAAFDIGRPRPHAPEGDRTFIVPLLREARRLARGELRVFANPHSAPGWMKQNGGMENVDPRVDEDVPACLLGYCAETPPGQDHRDDYVDYFVDFVRAYEEAGVPIDALGVQNEPGSPADYPGGDFDPDDQIDFIARLRRALDAQRPPMRQELWAELDPTASREILDQNRDRGAQHVDGLSFHCYHFNDTMAAQLYAGLDEFHAAYPDRTVHTTECTRDHNEVWPDTIDILIDHSRRWMSSVANWNVALDPIGGPQAPLCSREVGGGCNGEVIGTSMTAPVTVTDDGRAIFTREYYEMGHVAKFVRPGAVRIGSNDVRDVGNVAFENRDGSVVLVVHNRRDEPVRLAVGADHEHLDAGEIPAGAIATFVWPPG